MSDELDKFVLQYTVEMKDAVLRLQQLNGKLDDVGKTSKKSSNEVKEFATGAADEIGKLVPGIDAVTAAIRTMGTEFAVAGLAIGALAVGVKSVIDMRTQYNSQRREGMEIGVSPMRLEEYRRKFAKASGGNISGDQITDEVKKLAQFQSAVYRDPTRMGQEARTAKVLGIDMGMPGEPPRSVNSFLTQLGEKFSKITDAQVQAIAKTLGMNQDFALGLKKQGASVGSITEMTTEDIASRRVAQEQLDEFNAAMAKLADNFRQAENVLGEKLLPPFLEFIKAMARLSDILPKGVSKSADVMTAPISSSPLTTMTMSSALGPFGALMTAAMSILGLDSKKKAVQSVSGKVDAKKDVEKSVAKLLDSKSEFSDEKNEEARQLADQQALAINQFAGAVASFANAINEKQAWAAWAGEVGRAAGINGPAAIGKTPINQSTEPGRQGQTNLDAIGATKYAAAFEKAAALYASSGVTADILKKIARAESNFDPKAVSNQGALGLMQLMPANLKSLGVKDANDPEQNIIGGARLFADYMKRAGGDIRTALMMYHGGLDTSGWGKLTKAYPDKVLGATPSTSRSIAGGESRDKMQLNSVQTTIAQRLGVDVNMLKRGGVNRDDVSFAESQLEAGIQNHIFDLKNQLKAVNLPAQVRSKIMSDLMTQQMGLTEMRKYGEQVVNSSQAGPATITIGERAILINVNGTDDPASTAANVRAELHNHIVDLANGMASGIKY